MTDEAVTGTETGADTSTGAETTQAATTASETQTEDQKKFTQEDLDRHIQARLKKAERKFDERMDVAFDERLSQWRDENGVTEDALETLDKRPAYEREISTYKGKVTSLEKKLKAAEDKASVLGNHLLDTTGRDAVVREALAQGSVDPESVYLHVLAGKRLDVDHSTFKTVILDENGDPDPVTTITDLVTKTLEARPNLAKPRGAPGSGGRPKVGDAATATPKAKLGTAGGYADAVRERMSQIDGQ